MPYTPLPQHPATMADRIEALRVAQGVLAGGSTKGSMAATIFGERTSTNIPANNDGVMSLIRIAEYVTTGHDYLDTHSNQEPPTEEERTITVNVTGVADPEQVKDMVAKSVRKHLKKAGLWQEGVV